MARLLQEARVERPTSCSTSGLAPATPALCCPYAPRPSWRSKSDAELAARADATLRELGVDNVVLVQGPLEQGYAKQAP